MAGRYWVKSQLGADVPCFALAGGIDSDGSAIYVGRAQYNNETIPAKIIPSKNLCTVPYGGHEHDARYFEILCGENFCWLPCVEDNIPENAVDGGRTSAGETLYIGRVVYAGARTVGKVQPSCKCCFIPYGGKEYSFPDFEILVQIF